MKLGRFQFAAEHTILKPMWNGRKVGIAEYKIAAHNIIQVTTKNTEGKYIFSVDEGETPAKYYATGDQLHAGEVFKLKGGTVLRVVSISNLELYEGREGDDAE